MITRYAYGANFLLLFCIDVVCASSAGDCPQIVSNLERLACFDQAAGTRARPERLQWSAPEQDAPTVHSVMANEAHRPSDNLMFRMRPESSGPTGQRRLLISAPAIASTEPRSYLAISCVENISRLQLITGQPIDASWVKVQLKGERWATDWRPWQVMENGQVLDAGRGLPAIEQIKKLKGAHRIQVDSEHYLLDGLSFDAQGLGPLIDQARLACRW